MMLTRSSRIAVVGAGAVGGYYGGALARVGYEVNFLMRTGLEEVRRNGLRIRTGGDEWKIEAKAYASTDEIGPCDLVIVALKATANEILDRVLPGLMKPGTLLLTLQNGLGNEEYLAERWGKERVLGGLCFVCLNRTEPGVIEHFDHGTLSLGSFASPGDERVEPVAQAFREGGIEASQVESLITERWRKLTWNIPFNGLSIAGGGATVDCVLQSGEMLSLARALMHEVIDAAGKLGHDIPQTYAEFQIERSWSAGAYKPSSMIDWQMGRPVEVEAIWGEPLRRGLAAGAALPRLESLYWLLKYLTRERF